jgi:hypothetical protein
MMNTIISQWMKGIILIQMILLSQFAWAQESNNKEVSVMPKERKWFGEFAFGLGGFKTSGIPPSRNQINFESTNQSAMGAYQQESRMVGLAFSFELKRKLAMRHHVNLNVSFFKDDDEYLYANGKSNSIQQIQADSLKELTVRNYQSYLNVGVGYEFRVHQSKSGRHNVYVALNTGLSVNRTPDRTEYDYFEESGFIATDTTSEGIFSLTDTRFRDGFFLQPSVKYQFNFGENHGVFISLCRIYQWNSISRGYMNTNYGNVGHGVVEGYRLTAFQLKIGYSF